MARKPGHHFIQSSYLAEFTIEGHKHSQFWSIPINNSKPFRTNPLDSCKKRDYYTVEAANSLVVEDWYREKIEPKIMEAITYVKKNRNS